MSSNDNAHAIAIRKLAISVLAVLLVAAGLLILILEFGACQPNLALEYALFVILGCVASVVTFGILSSGGTITGRQQGWQVRLTGSVIPLALTTAGGVYGIPHTPDSALTLVFASKTNEQVTLSEPVRLVFPDTRETLMSTRYTANVAIFEHLPVSRKGKPQIEFDNESFVLANSTHGLTLEGAKVVEIGVVPRKVSAKPSQSPPTASPEGKANSARERCGPKTTEVGKMIVRGETYTINRHAVGECGRQNSEALDELNDIRRRRNNESHLQREMETK